MTDPKQNFLDYGKLQYAYLTEAENMFGPKTEYKYVGLFYNNTTPRVAIHDFDILTRAHSYKIELNGNAINDRTDGIFQLSHEVVHLLSPVELKDGNEVNYLEEGMATYFSKTITERDTGNNNFCLAAIAARPKYLTALKLYEALTAIDANAVKKLRKITPVIANIKHQDFVDAGLDIDPELTENLLKKFDR